MPYLKKKNCAKTTLSNGVTAIQTTISVSDASAFLDRSQGWLIGGQATINYHLNGKMDEIRMSYGVARSDAWRKARINGDNETLVSYGTEQICATADNSIFFGHPF